MDYLSKSQQIHQNMKKDEADAQYQPQSLPMENAPMMQQSSSLLHLDRVNAEEYKQPKNTFLEEDFYGRRSMFTDSSRELLDSLWGNRDSSSMQGVKYALSNLMWFHTRPVLTAEQLAKVKSFDDKEAGYKYAIEAMKQSIAHYSELASILSEMCDQYIEGHKHVWTKKGKKRLGMVKSIQEMALADAQRLSEEADGIFSDLGADNGEMEQVLKNQNWENVFSEAKKVRRFERAIDAAAGAEFEYEGKKYKIHTEESKEQSPVDLGGMHKTTAAYQTAKYLGIDDAFAETYNVTSQNKDETAILQEKVKGATLKEIIIRPIPVHYSDDAKRQMSNIAVFDCLSGYVDRNADSITAEYAHRKLADGTEYFEIQSVKVKDNASAFNGLMDVSVLKGGAKFMIDITKINYIDRRTYDAIMTLDINTLKFLLAGSGMTDASRELMQSRLDYIQDTLRERYRTNGEELFRAPMSAKDVVAVKNIYEDAGILEGGIDTILDKASRELDLKVKAAETKGEKIQEIEDLIRIEDEIDVDIVIDEEDASEGISFSMSFDDEQEKEVHEKVEQNQESEILQEEEEELVQEREEEIEKEEEIKLYDESQIVNFHIPGGDLLHEKYRSKKEHMKFEGLSYYSQRAKLTESEQNVSENLERMRGTENARVLKEAMDRIQSFHTSPVLTEAERSQIDLANTDTYPLLINMIKQAATKYSSMIESLNEDLRKYIVNHKPRSATGKQWIGNLKKLRRMLNIDKIAFMDEIDNITYNISAEADEIKNILEGGNWLSILSVSRSIDGAKVISLGNGEVTGASGTTAKYEYRGRRYFRKKNDPSNPYGSPMNSVGSYRMSSILATEDLYVAAFRMRERNLQAQDENAMKMLDTGDQKYGIIMEEARGKMLRELRHDQSVAGVLYSDDAKQQISRLIISDYIMGQIDRKDDNIMMDAEKRQLQDGRWCWYVKSIQAIDSDQSLATTAFLDAKAMADGFAFSPDISYLNYVDKVYFNYIMKMNPDAFEKTSKYAIADVAEGQDSQDSKRILTQTVNVMKERLIYMKKMLKQMYEERGEKMFEVPQDANEIITKHQTTFCEQHGGGYLNLSEFIFKSGLSY